MDERNLTGRAPWWFRKLVDAETAEYAARRKEDPMYGRRVTNIRHDGSDPVTPLYEGDELTLEQKLAKYQIVREPGDDIASAKLARTRVPAVRIPEEPAPVPHLGGFIRDHDADVENEHDPFEGGTPWDE